MLKSCILDSSQEPRVLDDPESRMEDEEKRVKKMIAISAAAKAVRYKEKFPKASEEEVIQHISDNADEIIEKIDDPL